MEGILLLYVAMTVAIGVQAKATTLENFILGERLGTRDMVATIVSTFYGASSILGGVSLTYQIGLGAIWFMAPFYFGNVLVVFLLHNIANSERHTLPDFLGGFYGGRFAVASSVLLATLCLIPEEIIAAGKILAVFTSIPVEMAMIIMTLLLIVPVAIGGMKADVRTDVLQFVLMLLTLSVVVPLAFMVSLRLGLTSGVPEGYLDPFAYMSAQEIAVFCVLLFFLPITSAPLYQRLFVSESEASSRKSVLYSVAIWIVIDSTIILCGFVALQLFPHLEDPDMSLVLLGTALPAVGRGIFYVGLLAAIMSTVNSFLQSGASSLAYDVFRYLRPTTSTGQLLALSRFLVVLLGLLSLILALWFQMIVPALLFTLSMWTAGILVPTLAALIGWGLREDTALYSLLGGALSSLAWKIVQPFDVDALFIGLGFSLIVAIASELLHKGRCPCQ
ncbi:MAG: sodium:solute symporter family protein [Chloroflexota bacterium]|nr:sodium:solute symporter family protein [Chloroflexota bacterium]